MFKSARIKLTFFYLVGIVVVSFFTSYGIRVLAQNTFENSNVDARGGIRSLIRSEVGLPFGYSPLIQLQDKQEDKVHKQLLVYTLYFDLLAVVIGGPLSYWFAGRTLKPIEEAHETQAKFASDASHELRTPLSVMKTENEVFLRQKNFSETEAREQITSNLEEIQRLESLTNNLLALSDSSKYEKIKLKSISARAIVNSTLEQIAKTHKDDQKQIRLEVKDFKVYGNLESMSQILYIFLDNAIKYSPNNKEIRLIGELKDEFYHFSVIDQGKGIAKQDMPLIFDRLYRGDKNRSNKIAGHGLGLALAKEIAKANHAGLSVSNNAGDGATFSLIVSTFKD
ncbi:MAG TPA: HAMP domain-containing sensor histidine kinase [Candidatus Saccharimonadia bacterium]|nr:HAMP domain-containing sensor histidine kinase [Candidatus Saccharimonadia bacterium]